MNTFSENPLFLFVDELVDGSPNFSTDGKIVELFDTGCDARTPGAAFKIGKEPDTIIHSKGSTQNNIPNVRKPFSLSLRQDKTPVKKNTRPAGQEDKIQIAGTCKLPNQSKPVMWNSKLKDKVATTESGISEVKSGRDSVVRNQSNAKVSEYSKRVGVSLVERKGKPNSTRTCTYSNYGENNRTVKSQLINSSVPKSYKVPDPGSTIYSTYEGRAKTSPTKPVTNTRMTLPTRTSKVISEASLNQGVKKCVNRAVDKDSLSNCSRQLEMAKTSGTPFFSKTGGYASRLPRSTAAAKSLPKGEIHLESPALIGTGVEATMRPENKTALMKIVGGTDDELQNKSLQNKTTKKIPTVNPWKLRDRPEGETASKVTLAASPMMSLQRKHEDDVKAKLSEKSCDVKNRDTVTRSSSKSKIAVSNVPLPRFGRNLLIGEKSVRKPGNPDRIGKVDQVSIARESKSNGKLSSKIENTDIAPCRDSENKLSASERLATDLDKVPARPSAKSHNLTPRESDGKNTTISSRTEFSKSKTPTIAPKLMAEFRHQEKKHGEVSRCSPRSPAVPSATPEVKIPNGKLRTDSNGKPPRTSGILSDELNERLSRFSDRVQEVLGTTVPLLSGVTECTGIGHRSVDRNQQGKLKVDVRSVSLSGVKAAEENDEEIELKTIFEDTSVTAGRQPTPKLSKIIPHSGARKARELKLRHPAVCPSVTGSKVPRPVITKRIPRKEMARNFSTRTYPKKQESSTPRGAPKKLVKNPLSDTKPSTPPTKKSVDHIPESKNSPKTSVVAEEDEAEDVIPIMNPALYNIHSFATHYRNRGNLENAVPQVTVHGAKLESWIDGHEQAYLKGRAIGLKVASMARAAKENLKREFVRSGLRNTTPKSLPDKSREIVDIGVSVIEKVLAEKANKIYSPSVREDQILNYGEFDKNTKWNSKQWFT